MTWQVSRPASIFYGLEIFYDHLPGLFFTVVLSRHQTPTSGLSHQLDGSNFVTFKKLAAPPGFGTSTG